MKKLRVIIVEPLKAARMEEINGDLETMQKIVGGYIEAVPIDGGDVSIVCNEEGKFGGYEPNRALYSNGKLADIVYGTFFICATPPTSDNFESLSDEQLIKYQVRYMRGERFMRTERGIVAIKH